MDRDLTELDFTARHKLAFDLQGNELTPSARYDFKFKDYAPWVFRDLRKIFQIDAADYLVSLTGKYILSELGSPGKSGSFFYFSRDYRFIIKTLHHAEHKFLRRILREYHKHTKLYPNTLISQFYGLHRVKTSFGKKIHFVVMNNLFPPHMDIHSTYDVKGSTVGRVTSDDDKKGNPRGTLKDLNWLSSKQYLKLSPKKKTAFLDQVQKDVELLASLKIMDYSLLLGVHNMAEVSMLSPLASTTTPDRTSHPTALPSSPGPLIRTPSVAGQNYRHRDLRRMVTPRDGPITLSQLQPPTNPTISLTHSGGAQQPASIDRTLNESNTIPLNSIFSIEPGLQQSVGMQHNIFYQFEGGVRSQNPNGTPGDVIYFLGIIDLLTNYGPRKKLENLWKGLGRSEEVKKQISAVPPQRYASRFRDFVSGMTKSPEEVLKARLERTPSAVNLESAMHELERERVESRIPESGNVLRAVQAHDNSGELVLPVLEEVGSQNQRLTTEETDLLRVSTDDRRKHVPSSARLHEAAETHGARRASLEDLHGAQARRKTSAVSLSSEPVFEEVEPDGHDSGLATSLDCLPEESEHSRQSSISRPAKLQMQRMTSSDSAKWQEHAHIAELEGEFAPPLENERRDAALLATYQFNGHDSQFRIACPKTIESPKRQIDAEERAARRRGIVELRGGGGMLAQLDKSVIAEVQKTGPSESFEDEGYQEFPVEQV